MSAALFVRDDPRPLPGALPMSAVGLDGAALPPSPAIVVSFRSETTGCAKPDTCGVDVADTEYQQNQGIHSNT